ncbi:MAG: hypothetical protein KME10_17160 [Plectolyngbya sp. WJT66-NPBG17]|jgi:hypothetical protein|nr:hypothetical protein [Plectolyngbya sp. WJT66-NPBG17]MBW4526013.1 hypothetical protein [Phormidium tanganyikae FI6-MK23]
MDHNLDTRTKVLLKLLQNLGLVDRFDLKTDLLQPPLNRDPASETGCGGRSSPQRSSHEDSSHQPGEIPAVQDRFHALLKRRLLLEAQQNPPLFPWEKEAVEYEIEPTSYEAQPALAAASVWLHQIRHMNLPIPMPEAVMTELLARCQSVLFSSLREGAKLVRAVDTLFPGQSQLLNNVAGYVMVSPARSKVAKLQDLAIEIGEELPESFDSAIETQQMALSLLAAREILSTLMLTVSPVQPQLEREWLTELGAFLLKVGYEAERLRIEAVLPCGGSLLFQGEESRSLVDRNDAGRLSLEIREFNVDRVYPLEIRLGEQDVLTFAVSIQK